MKMLIPNELKEYFSSKLFDNLVSYSFDATKIGERKYLNTLSYEDTKKLFEAFIAYNYNNLSSDDERIAYLRMITSKLLVLSLTEGFINSFVLASLSDREIKEELGKAQVELNKLRYNKKHEYYKSLDKYDGLIATIIDKEESIQSKSYKIDMDELISLSKCYIVKEMIESDEPYGIINDMDSDQSNLTMMVLNACFIYSNGTKNFNERKLEAKIELQKLSDIIGIAKSEGFLR